MPFHFPLCVPLVSQCATPGLLAWQDPTSYDLFLVRMGHLGFVHGRDGSCFWFHPAWLRLGGLSPSNFPLVPIQILDTCLRSVLQTRPFVSPLFSASIMPLPLQTTGTWFPVYQKFLSHTWIHESGISSKAVKHDDVAVPPVMWDLPITLLYPWNWAQGLHLLHFFGFGSCSELPASHSH